MQVKQRAGETSRGRANGSLVVDAITGLGVVLLVGGLFLPSFRVEPSFASAAPRFTLDISIWDSRRLFWALVACAAVAAVAVAARPWWFRYPMVMGAGFGASGVMYTLIAEYADRPGYRVGAGLVLTSVGAITLVIAGLVGCALSLQPRIAGASSSGFTEG